MCFSQKPIKIDLIIHHIPQHKLPKASACGPACICPALCANWTKDVLKQSAGKEPPYLCVPKEFLKGKGNSCCEL